MALPTARTLKWLRDRGHKACVVERYNHHTRTRHDAFNVGDILAFPTMAEPDVSVMLVQATSTSNMASRIAKIHAEPVAQFWLASPRRTILVFGWAKRGKAGKRKLWKARIVRVMPGGHTEVVADEVNQITEEHGHDL